MRDSDYSCAGNQHLFKAGSTACCCGKKSVIADFDKHKREHPEFYPPPSPAFRCPTCGNYHNEDKPCPSPAPERECPGLNTEAYHNWHGGCDCTMAEIAALRAEQERLDGLYEQNISRVAEEATALEERADKAEAMRDKYEALAREFTQRSIDAEARAERLAAALAEYGQHHADCYKSIPRDREEDPEPCSCGFDAALAEEKE